MLKESVYAYEVYEWDQGNAEAVWYQELTVLLFIYILKNVYNYIYNFVFE